MPMFVDTNRLAYFQNISTESNLMVLLSFFLCCYQSLFNMLMREKIKIVRLKRATTWKYLEMFLSKYTKQYILPLKTKNMSRGSLNSNIFCFFCDFIVVFFVIFSLLCLCRLSFVNFFNVFIVSLVCLFNLSSWNICLSLGGHFSHF